jgi:hypothetical protein
MWLSLRLFQARAKQKTLPTPFRGNVLRKVQPNRTLAVLVNGVLQLQNGLQLQFQNGFQSRFKLQNWLWLQNGFVEP